MASATPRSPVRRVCRSASMPRTMAASCGRPGIPAHQSCHRQRVHPAIGCRGGVVCGSGGPRQGRACHRPGRQVRGHRRELRVGPRAIDMLDPRAVLLRGETPLSERFAKHADGPLPVCIRCPHAGDHLACWSRIHQLELADVWRCHRVDLLMGLGRWGCRIGISSPRLSGCCDSAGFGLSACPSGWLHFLGPSWPPGAARAKSLLRIAARDTTPDANAMIAATSRMRCAG